MKLVLLILSCGLCAALSATAYAAFYLPETSTRTMEASPLRPGEAAYVRDPQGTATIYIGGNTGDVYRVAEPTGLRGQRVEIVPDAEIAVVSENVVASNGAWYAIGSSTTGTVAFVTRGGESIESFTFDRGEGSAGLSPDTAIIVGNVHGSELRFMLMPHLSEWCCISNVVCRRAAYGDTPFVNDLTHKRYEMLDELGELELGKLRTWTKNLYNGNRGEDWASYPATNDVRIGTHSVRFGRMGRYGFREDGATNLVLQAGGRAAMTVAFHGISTNASSFAITSIVYEDSTVYLTYTIDADNFNLANLAVKTKSNLNGEWRTLTSSEYTATSSTVVIPDQTGNNNFYQLVYDGQSVTSVLEVRFRGNVVIEDALILKGTDSKFYQITVGAGGTISATEVTP